MSFLCSCAGRRRKRSESDDRQEYYRRRSRSASRTPPPAAAATPKVKRKFPTGITSNPSVPSDLEENSSAAVADKKASKPKSKDTPKVKDTKVKDTRFKDTAKVQFDTKIAPGSAVRKTPVAEKRTQGTMTAPGAGEVIGYEQTILPRVRKKSPPVVAARMEVTLKSTRRADPITIATQCDDTIGSSGSDTPRGYEGSVSSSDAGSGSPRDAQTQCGFSDFSDDESSLLSLGREEAEYESTVSEIRDTSADAGGAGPDVWDPGFLQHDRIWMDIKSTLMDLITDKDSEAFQELQESMKPPDMTYCTVFRKMDGSVTHKAREDSKKVVRHSFGGVPAEKVQGSRSKLNLVALRDRSDQDAPDWNDQRRRSGRDPEDTDYEDYWTPGAEFDDKLFTPDAEVTEYYFGRHASVEPEEPPQQSTPRKTPDVEITEFYFGRRASSEKDVPALRSESQITLRSFQGGTMSEALRSSMSAIWPPAAPRAEKFGGSARELKTVSRGERISDSLRSSLSAIWPGGSSTDKKEKVGGSACELKTTTSGEEGERWETTNKDSSVQRDEPDEGTSTVVRDLPVEKHKTSVYKSGNITDHVETNITASEVDKPKRKDDTSKAERGGETDRTSTLVITTEEDEVKDESSKAVEAASGVKMRQKGSTRSFDRSMSDSSTRTAREGTPITQDLKAQKELWRQGIAFEGKEFDITDVDLESMEVEPVPTEIHEKNRQHPKRVNRRKETSELRSFSLDYERRSPKVVRKRPAKPIVALPYASARMSHPPAKDHSKHKLKVKNEDRIDDDPSAPSNTMIDDAPEAFASTGSENIGKEPLPQSTDMGPTNDINIRTDNILSDKVDTSRVSGDLVESAAGLRSPGVVRSIIDGRFKTVSKTKEKAPTDRTVDSENKDLKLSKEDKTTKDSSASSESREKGEKNVAETVTKPRRTLKAPPKKAERLEKLKQQTSLPEIDAESRFVSRPSEVKRSGKIELISPPPDEEGSEDSKPRRTKKTRNVGRFLPTGGLTSMDVGCEVTPQNVSPKVISNLALTTEPSEETMTEDRILYSPDIKEDLGKLESHKSAEPMKQKSETSSTEPDLVTTHGSPHSSLDEQFLKLGNSREDPLSKGGPDVIVQCFSDGVMSAENEENLLFPKSPDFNVSKKKKENSLMKHSTAFSADSTSFETVVSVSNMSFKSTEDETLPNVSGEVEAVSEADKENVQLPREAKEKSPVEIESSETRNSAKVLREAFALATNVPHVFDQQDRKSFAKDEDLSLKFPDSVPVTDDVTEGSQDVLDYSHVTVPQSIVLESSKTSVRDIKPKPSSSSTSEAKNIVDITARETDPPNIISGTEFMQSSVPQDENNKQLVSDTIKSKNVPEAFVVSPDTLARLSNVSLSKDDYSLFSSEFSGSPIVSPRSTTHETSQPGSGVTSPKRNSYLDTFHPLPKVETTVDQTPLGSPFYKDTITVENTAPSRTPRVRLSDIVITGSVEEKIIALAKSETSHVMDPGSKPAKSYENVPADINAEETRVLDETIDSRDSTSEASTKELMDSTVSSSTPDTIVSTSNPNKVGLTSPVSITDVKSQEVFSTSDSQSAVPVTTVNDDSMTSSLRPSSTEAVVATEQEQQATEEVLGSLPEHRDIFLPTVRDTKSWTPPDKTFEISKVISTAMQTKIEAGKEKKGIDTEDEKTDGKSEESGEKESKTKPKVVKVKKGDKKVSKLDKPEKSKKNGKTDGKSSKADTSSFPPPDRPIRIAVRPSAKLRALGNGGAPVTPTSSSPETTESNLGEEPKEENSFTKEESESYLTLRGGSQEAKSEIVPEDSSNIEVISGLLDKVSTRDKIPKDDMPFNNVISSVSSHMELVEETVKKNENEALKDMCRGISSVTNLKQQKSLPTDTDGREDTNVSEKVSPDRDSLEGDIPKLDLRPGDLITRAYSATPMEMSSLTTISPLPSPRDSLDDSQSIKDSEFSGETDSLHRDSFSENVVKGKSQSPRDSLDETSARRVSDSVPDSSERPPEPKRDADDLFTTPQDSLEGSPTKAVTEERVSFSGSVDDDKILSFSSIWSPRISLQRNSDIIPETREVSTASNIGDVPLISAGERLPHPIPDSSEVVAIIKDVSPVLDSQRKCVEVKDPESTARIETLSQEISAASSSDVASVSPSVSQKNSFDELSKSSSKKLETKDLNRSISEEATAKDDLSSVSSAASPRDSLSSKRESSTISDSRLSTTDTSVIDDILGVASSPFTKVWTESTSQRESGSIPDSPQRTSLRASLAVEEGFSSSPGTSPRDSIEESQTKRIPDMVPESLQLASKISRDSAASLNPESTPRGSLDLGFSGFIPETHHRVSLADSDLPPTFHSDSGDHTQTSSPRISQKDITESFQKYFAGLDPKLTGLRDSKISTGSGDSRKSAASDSDFDIIDFTEPDLLVLSDLPVEHISLEQHPQAPPTPSSSEPTPTIERTQSMLSGGFDIMYIDTSSFDDDKTPKRTSDSESSPTREVAKVMEELASVLANAEKGFDTDTTTSRDSHIGSSGREDSREEESLKGTPKSRTSTDSLEEQWEKDRDIFRKIAESSMDAGMDVEASFDAMVDSLLTPRSSGVVVEESDEPVKKSTSKGIAVKKFSERTEKVPSVVITDTDVLEGQVCEPSESSKNHERTKPTDMTTHLLKDDLQPNELEKSTKESSEDSIESDKQPRSKSEDDSFTDSNRNGTHGRGEADIRGSTFGVAKMIQEIMKSQSLQSTTDTKPMIGKEDKKVLASSVESETLKETSTKTSSPRKINSDKDRRQIDVSTDTKPENTTGKSNGDNGKNKVVRVELQTDASGKSDGGGSKKVPISLELEICAEKTKKSIEKSRSPEKNTSDVKVETESLDCPKNDDKVMKTPKEDSSPANPDNIVSNIEAHEPIKQKEPVDVEQNSSTDDTENFISEEKSEMKENVVENAKKGSNLIVDKLQKEPAIFDRKSSTDDVKTCINQEKTDEKDNIVKIAKKEKNLVSSKQSGSESARTLICSLKDKESSKGGQEHTQDKTATNADGSECLSEATSPQTEKETLNVKKSQEKIQESLMKEEYVQTDSSKRRSKSKSKSLSRDGSISSDALSVAVEMNVPLPPDNELQDDEFTVDKSKKKANALKTSTSKSCSVEEDSNACTTTSQVIIDTEKIVSLKEGEAETKTIIKRQAGDWSKSFSLEKDSTLEKDEERAIPSEAQKSDDMISKSSESTSDEKKEYEVKHTHKYDPSLESQEKQDIKMSQLFGGEDVLTCKVDQVAKKSSDEKFESGDRESTRSKSSSVVCDDGTTDPQENISTNYESSANETRRSKSKSISAENETEINPVLSEHQHVDQAVALDSTSTIDKAEDSGLEDEEESLRSENIDRKNNVSKKNSKPSRRVENDVTGEQVPDTPDQSPPIDSEGRESQPDWSGPIRREKKSRRSVKTSKSRSISLEEQDLSIPSPTGKCDDSGPSPERLESVKEKIYILKEEMKPQKASIGMIKSKSRSRDEEDPWTVVPQQQISPISESEVLNGRHRPTEKPRSILKSSSREKVECLSTTGDQASPQERDVISFDESFVKAMTKEQTLPTVTGSETMDADITTEDGNASESPTGSPTSKQSTHEHETSILADYKQYEEQRRLRKFKSKSSSKEDEPTTAFPDEKFVAPLTETQDGGASEFLDAFYNESRSCRNSGRRSTSKSVSFEDDVMFDIQPVEVDTIENIPNEPPEDKDDLDSSFEKPAKSKMERRKSPKKKSKSRTSGERDDAVIFDSSFQIIPEHGWNPQPDVTGDSDLLDVSSGTPDVPLLPRVEITEAEPEFELSYPREERPKSKVDRKKSPKKKSKSKEREVCDMNTEVQSVDRDTQQISDLSRRVLEGTESEFLDFILEDEISQNTTNMSKRGKGTIVSPESLSRSSAESTLPGRGTIHVETENDSIGLLEEKATKNEIERRKSPKKKSKSSRGGEESFTNLFAGSDFSEESLPSIPQPELQETEDMFNVESPSIRIERKQSPKKKSKHKKEHDDDIITFFDPLEATVIENTLTIPKLEQLESEEGVDATFGDEVKNKKIERRKSPKKKSKSKTSTAEADEPERARGSRDSFLPTVSTFEVDKTEFTDTHAAPMPPEKYVEKHSVKSSSRSVDLEINPSTAEHEIAGEDTETFHPYLSKEKPLRTKARSKSKSESSDHDFDSLFVNLSSVQSLETNESENERSDKDRKVKTMSTSSDTDSDFKGRSISFEFGDADRRIEKDGRQLKSKTKSKTKSREREVDSEPDSTSHNRSDKTDESEQHDVDGSSRDQRRTTRSRKKSEDSQQTRHAIPSEHDAASSSAIRDDVTLLEKVGVTTVSEDAAANHPKSISPAISTTRPQNIDLATARDTSANSEDIDSSADLLSRLDSTTSTSRPEDINRFSASSFTFSDDMGFLAAAPPSRPISMESQHSTWPLSRSSSDFAYQKSTESLVSERSWRVPKVDVRTIFVGNVVSPSKTSAETKETDPFMFVPSEEGKSDRTDNLVSFSSSKSSFADRASKSLSFEDALKVYREETRKSEDKPEISQRSPRVSKHSIASAGSSEQQKSRSVDDNQDMSVFDVKDASRSKPPSRGGSTVSEKSVSKTAGSFESTVEIGRVSDTRRKEHTHAQEFPAIPPSDSTTRPEHINPPLSILKRPSREGSTISVKSIDRQKSSDNDAVPITVCAPLRWSAALPENIDLSHDPIEETEMKPETKEEKTEPTVCPPKSTEDAIKSAVHSALDVAKSLLRVDLPKGRRGRSKSPKPEETTPVPIKEETDTSVTAVTASVATTVSTSTLQVDSPKGRRRRSKSPRHAERTDTVTSTAPFAATTPTTLQVDSSRSRRGRSKSPRPEGVALFQSKEEDSRPTPAGSAAQAASTVLGDTTASTASPSARRRRARARRRAAAAAAGQPDAHPSIAEPLDWAAEVEAELPLEEGVIDPFTPTTRRKRKRHRRKRARADAAPDAAPVAAPAVDTATDEVPAPAAAPGRIKRLKSCEEEGSVDATGAGPNPPVLDSGTRRRQEKPRDKGRPPSPPLSPRRVDDDPTPWSVVRSRRHRHDNRKSHSFEGEGFRFQDPAKGLRLSSGSEGGDKDVFYFEAQRDKKRSPALLHERRDETKKTTANAKEGSRGSK